MISCMGDGPTNNGKGSFVIIDGKDWKVKGTYNPDQENIPPFGYMRTMIFIKQKIQYF